MRILRVHIYIYLSILLNEYFFHLCLILLDNIKIVLTSIGGILDLNGAFQNV